MVRDDSLFNEFASIAEEIAENPEVAFEEHHARGVLAEWLATHGFIIEAVAGLPTSFIGRIGQGKPNVAMLLEYDALPTIGHGCGHQLIAAGGGLAAILASRQLSGAGTVTVVGCPAEEKGAGKAHLVESGVFADVDAAMMFHPASTTVLARSSLAAVGVSIEFFGRASHTARAPEHGRNALSGAIILFNGTDALRARLGRWTTLSGYIAEGGVAANIVPEYARVELLLRDTTTSRVGDLLHEVTNIANAAALATGTEVKVTADPHAYAERRNNRTMLKALADDMRRSGLAIEQPRNDESLGSSDIGNVSLVVPTIHPTLNVAESPTPSHTREFAQVCRQPKALSQAYAMSTALASLATRFLRDEELRNGVMAEFANGGFDAPGTDFSDLADSLSTDAINKNDVIEVG